MAYDIKIIMRRPDTKDSDAANNITVRGFQA